MPASKDQQHTLNAIPARLAKPAQRALLSAGITNLVQLSKISEAELSALHGIGKNAIAQLQKALVDNGLSFSKKKK